MGAHKYNARFVFNAYKFAREGYTATKLAQALGVEYRTLLVWKRKHPAFAMALKEGRKDRIKEGEFSFKDYVFKRLPTELQDLWEQLNELDAEGKETNAIEKLLRRNGEDARKHLFLYSLVYTNYNMSEACRKVNIAYRTVRRWCEQDPQFNELVEEIQVHKKNFFESALVQLVADGDKAATIFANRTINADRGYSEKFKIESDQGNSPMLDLETLDLPLEARRALLAAIRRKQLKDNPQTEPVQQLKILEGVKVHEDDGETEE